MELFETTEDIVRAVTNCEDPQEKESAIRVAVAFAMHDKSVMTSGVEKPGLPNKVTLSLLVHGIQNMGKPREEVV